MKKSSSPPVLVGTLAEPFYAISFGILVALFSVKIGSLLTPYYFGYVVLTVISVEALLWSFNKSPQEYEVFKPPERERMAETQNSLATPEDAVPKKRQSPSGAGKTEKVVKESRFRRRHKKNTSESPVESPP